MTKLPSSARPSLSALLLMLIGNLVIVSAIIIPILPASIVTFSCGSHSCLMGGPRITLLSGWQILTYPGPHPARMVMLLQKSSYVTLAPLALASWPCSCCSGRCSPMPRPPGQSSTARSPSSARSACS